MRRRSESVPGCVHSFSRGSIAETHSPNITALPEKAMSAWLASQEKHLFLAVYSLILDDDCRLFAGPC